MTYAELKLATMQKMFHDITSLTEDAVTKPYLDKMAYVANCAIQRACMVGLGKRKYISISRVAIPNMIENHGKYEKTCAVAGEDAILTATCGKAYFFNVCGEGEAQIFVGDRLFKTVSFNTSDSFVQCKGIIENAENKKIKIVFLRNKPYVFSYPAVYDISFSSEEEICENNDYIHYNINELTEDFYRFDSENCIIEKSDGEGISYKIIDGETVAVKGDVSGVWSIPYYAYPVVIMEDTSDDEEIDLPLELCLILPYYMASELYLEDDSGLSISWRNKFESSLSEYAFLKNKSIKRKYEVVHMTGGVYGDL